MAFSTSYTYIVIDKFSAPLRKIGKASESFRSSMRKSAKTVDRLSNKLQSVKGVATATANAMGGAAVAGKINKLDRAVKPIPGKLNEVAKAGRKIPGKLDAISTSSNRLGRSFKKTGGAASKFSNKMSSLQGVAAGIGGAIGGKIMMDHFVGFEEAINVARGTTKATDAEWKQLAETAKTLGKTTQFSATQAAKGIDMLGRNGLTATQIMNGAIDSTLLLSAATGTDLANAADIATDTMSNFGLKASEMGRVVDKIAGVTINSKFSIDDYRLALAQAGGVAGALGVPIDDFNTAIAATAPLFASGSDSGTSFKTFLQRLNPQSKEAARMMQRIGLYTEESGSAFFDAAGNIKSMTEVSELLNQSFGRLSDKQLAQAASTIFGMDGMRSAIGMSKLGTKEFGKLAKEIDKVSAQKLAEDRMKGLTGALKKMKSAVGGLNIAIFDAGLDKTLGSITSKITKMTNALSESHPEILRIIGILGLMAMIATPVVIAAAIIGKAIIVLAGIFGIGVLAMGGWVIGIAAAIAALVALRVYRGEIKDSIREFSGHGEGFLNKWLKKKNEFNKLGFPEGPTSPLKKIPSPASSFKIEEPKGFLFQWMKKRKESIAADNATATNGTIDGDFRVSASPGSKVDEAHITSTLPGNMGVNIAGAGGMF